MATKDIFAQRLCAIRELKGLSRQKVADDLGISRASLEYYEKGKRAPDINTINTIAEYFNVNIDYLFGKTKCTSLDEDIRKICDYFDTDVNTVTGLKKITMDSSKYSDEFRKIIHSSHFTALLYHIYLSFYLKKELGKMLVKELNDTTVLANENAEMLFDKYGEDGYSSDIERKFKESEDKIDLNEYRAQKELLAIMSLYSKDYSDFSSDSYEDYINEYVPTEKFFDDILQEINYCISDINHKIGAFIEEQYYMDAD